MCLTQLDRFRIELEGKTAGIVGLGDIGSRIARFAQAFGMNVVYASRTEKTTTDLTRVAITELLQISDAVFLTLPLTDETKHIIDDQAFTTMRPNCILINVSAEGLVERTALVGALASGEIGGAGLDFVGSAGPYLGVPNITVTPAHGWYTAECMERRAAIWIETLACCLAGKPRNVVVNRLGEI